MKNVTICYIGGGSKNWAQKYFSDLVVQDKLCGEIRLYDINLHGANLNKHYFEKLLRNNKGKINDSWKCEVFGNINEALKGCDIVIISILPYSLFNMYHDVHHAERYGDYQSVGDTVGVGGYSRAFRTLTDFIFFGQKIKENCPDAWVINYTNPMSMCTNTLYAAFPKIKAFGCCHEVFSSQKLICAIMDMYNALDEEGKKAFLASDYEKTKANLKKVGLTFNDWKHPKTDRHEIYTNVQGVNHFTFINEANYKGTDLMPIYKAFVPMYKKFKKSKYDVVKFDIYNRYGIFGAAGNRHLAEFIPEDYLPLHQKHYGKQGFTLTTVANRIARDWLRRIQLFFLTYGPFKLKPHKSGEEGTSQLIALMGLGDIISNVNVPNKGQAPDLPLGTAVETNAKFSDNKIEPIECGPIVNKFLHDRVTLHANNQKDFVAAFIAKDKEKIKEVFMRDPQVSRLDKETQIKLFNELIDCNKKVLPEWLLK